MMQLISGAIYKPISLVGGGWAAQRRRLPGRQVEGKPTSRLQGPSYEVIHQSTGRVGMSVWCGVFSSSPKPGTACIHDIPSDAARPAMLQQRTFSAVSFVKRIGGKSSYWVLAAVRGAYIVTPGCLSWSYLPIISVIGLDGDRKAPILFAAVYSTPRQFRPLCLP
jgi:hypothetical protein